MIGLCAQSRMGKDTVADFIVKSYPYFHKRAFGDELKKLICHYFEISRPELEEYKTSSDIHPNIRIRMRQTLQIIGETMRQVSTDVWVKNAMKTINDTESYIFTDVRHENEMEEIQNKNGNLILLGRSKYLSQDPHPSEQNLQNAITWFLNNTSQSFVVVSELENVPETYQKFTLFIRNDGSLQDFEKDIVKMCKYLDIKTVRKNT
jgi:hypothetical protein